MIRPNPDWLGRDRFVLSAGHTSLTLYIQLFLSGYGLELKDLEALRTWGSLTPGHPEYKHTAGVEITTGPLGQGLASAVGSPYSQRRQRGLFDADAPAGESPFDHTIWVIASDGDLQEGVTSEASSLAGHQELGNLVVIYDENHISIEDDTDIAFTEDVLKRYEAYGWHIQRVDWTRTGEYKEDIAGAARRPAGRQGRNVQAVDHVAADHHRLPGAEEAEHRQDPRLRAGLRGSRGPEGGPGLRPGEVLRGRRGRPGPRPLRGGPRRGRPQAEWEESFDGLAGGQPGGRGAAERVEAESCPRGLDGALPVFEAGKDVSTRAASGKVLNALGPVMPELWGGSADLAESNNTTIEGLAVVHPARSRPMRGRATRTAGCCTSASASTPPRRS